MARKLSMIVIAAVALAALLQISVAQTTYEVGDSSGWIIPTGGSAAYVTWAANKTFTVGDVLVFNFTTGQHDVAEVSKTAYDSCNSTSPISTQYTGPTNITLKTAGSHYYICTFTQHCSLGQKLAINVSTTTSSPAPQPSSPAPQPSTPSPKAAPTPAPSTASTPATAPSPSPSRAPVTYEVGDTLGGWVIPQGSAASAAYQTWARGKTFLVGDTLVFNFTTGQHDVAQVTKAAYDACNNTATPIFVVNTGPASVKLNTTGEHYYICLFTQHCNLGQKLAINVSSSGSTSPSPQAATPPGSATSPSGSTTPTTPSSPSPAGSNPPPSSGSFRLSVAAAGFSATFLSIAVAVLLY